MYPLGDAEFLHSDHSPSKARTKRQLTHIISPSMSLKTDLYEEVAFKRMLQALVQMDFGWLARYSGPRIGIRIPRGRTMDVGELITALDEHEIRNLPITGMKAVLVHDMKEGIYAKLKVNGFRRTKVNLKGTIEFAFWDEIQKEFHSRLDEAVEGQSV